MQIGASAWNASGEDEGTPTDIPIATSPSNELPYQLDGVRAVCLLSGQGTKIDREFRNRRKTPLAGAIVFAQLRKRRQSIYSLRNSESANVRHSAALHVRAVLSGGHGAEPETAGVIPQQANPADRNCMNMA